MSEEEAKKVLKQMEKAFIEIRENMYKIWEGDDIIPYDHTQSAAMRGEASCMINHMDESLHTLNRMFRSMGMR